MDNRITRQYCSAVLANRNRFEQMVRTAVAERNHETACAQIEEAARFAALCGTGIYASSDLESKLRGIAEIIETGDVRCRPVPEGTLLVATELYAQGGHTKVLERFGEMFAEEGEKVSLFMTSPANKYIPAPLRDAVHESGGSVVEERCSEYCERAKHLREYASLFRRVILMTHPEDVLPVLAFGTRNFKRPVFTYGHANHTFWLGVSISDRVLELNKWGSRNDIALRGVPKERIDIVGLPVAQTAVAPSAIDRQALYRNYGIPTKGQLIVTAASPRKFRTVGNLDFREIAEGVLSKSEDSAIVVVGPDVSGTPEWNCIRSRYPNRLVCLGPLKYPDLLACYVAADIVIDSYPLNGWTSLTDAITMGAAVVCPQGAMGLMDYLVDSPAYAPDAKSAVEKILALLVDKDARSANAHEMRRRMTDSTDYAIVKKRLLGAIEKVSDHSIYEFTGNVNNIPTVQDMAIYAMTVRRKQKWSFLGVRFFSVRFGTTKKHSVEFGGHPWNIALPWRLKKILGFPCYIFRRLRVSKKYFDHIHSLGFNCEVAYRFFKSNGFVESSLFSWTYAPDLKILVNALLKLEFLFSGRCMRPDENGGLHKCAVTGMFFHGREHQKTWLEKPFDEVCYQKDLNDLKGRIEYLEKKFLKQLRDDSSVLLIYKISSQDKAFANADAAIIDLFTALRNLGARNVRLLVICERKMLGYFPDDHPDYDLRCVEEFNPLSRVANTKFGDYYGWRLLFDEFKSRYMPTRKKTYKFERQ